MSAQVLTYVPRYLHTAAVPMGSDDASGSLQSPLLGCSHSRGLFITDVLET